MSWPQLAHEYFQAATELRDVRHSFVMTVHEGLIVAQCASSYLDDVLFCVDVAVEDGRLHKKHSRQARAIQYSDEFKRCKALTRNLNRFLARELHNSNSVPEEWGDRIVLFTHDPQATYVEEFDITEMKTTARQFRTAQSRVSDRILKFCEDFDEPGASLPISRSEYRKKFSAFDALIKEAKGFQERRALATTTFPSLKNYQS